MSPRNRSRRAFTLIELMVVITVILVLAGMILAVSGRVLESARASATAARMGAIITALAAYQIQGGSAALALQERCALGGPGRFATIESIRNVVRKGGSGRADPPSLGDTTTSRKRVLEGDSIKLKNDYLLTPLVFDVVPPATGAVAATWYTDQWKAQWPQTDWFASPPGSEPPILRFPWGRVGLRRDLKLVDPATAAGSVVGTINGGYSIENSWVSFGNPPGTSEIWTYSLLNTTRSTAVQTPYSAKRSDGTTLSVDSNKPMPFDIGWMSPQRSITLLQAAGILTDDADGAAAYRTDRSRNREWNDKWGNPLVVSFALFAPERVHSTDATGDQATAYRDGLLKAALDLYGFNRALYITVGAAGNGLATDLSTWAATDDPVRLRDLWREICTAAAAHEWNELSFDQPPWKGIRVQRSPGRIALISNVQEIR